MDRSGSMVNTRHGANVELRVCPCFSTRIPIGLSKAGGENPSFPRYLCQADNPVLLEFESGHWGNNLHSTLHISLHTPHTMLHTLQSTTHTSHSPFTPDAALPTSHFPLHTPQYPFPTPHLTPYTSHSRLYALILRFKHL